MSLQGIDFGTPGTGGAANLPVPDVTGDLRPVAEQKLTNIGFKPKATEIEAAGTLDEVIAQDPAPSTLKPKDSEVRIFVITAPAVTVPDVVGEPREDAEQAIEDAGLKAVVERIEAEGTQGNVHAQDPVPGTKKPAGSTVRLLVIATPVDVEQRFTSVDQAVQNVTGKLDTQSTTLGDVSTKLDGVATAASVEAISEKLDAVATSASVDELKQAVTAVGTDVGGLDDKVDDPVTRLLNEIKEKVDSLTPPTRRRRRSRRDSDGT